jgi:hypothetical protein
MDNATPDIHLSRSAYGYLLSRLPYSYFPFSYSHFHTHTFHIRTFIPILFIFHFHIHTFGQAHTHTFHFLFSYSRLIISIYKILFYNLYISSLFYRTPLHQARCDKKVCFKNWSRRHASSEPSCVNRQPSEYNLGLISRINNYTVL